MHTYPVGVRICDPCRLFFRRQFKQPLIPKCKKTWSCNVSKQEPRKRCSGCRFQQLLQVGMKPRLPLHHKDNLPPSNLTDELQVRKPTYIPTPTVMHHDELNHFLQLASFLPDLSRIDSSPPHNYLFLVKKDLDLDLRIVEIAAIPFVSFRITIEMPEKEVVPEDSLSRAFAGLSFSETVNNIVLNADIDQRVVFDRTEDLVVVSNRDTALTMASVSDSQWHRICLMGKVWLAFQDLTPITYSFPSIVNVLLPRTGYKFVDLMTQPPKFEKRVRIAFEIYDPFFGTLSEIDKMILLKEVMPGFMMLRLCLNFDYSRNAVAKSCLNGKLAFCIHLDGHRTHSSHVPYYEAISEFVHGNWVDDRIRMDIFVMIAMMFIYFYEDRPGLFGKEAVSMERSLYEGILNKYIDGMVAADAWVGTAQEIKGMLQTKLQLLETCKKMVRNLFFQALYSTPEPVLKDHGIKFEL